MTVSGVVYFTALHTTGYASTGRKAGEDDDDGGLWI